MNKNGLKMSVVSGGSSLRGAPGTNITWPINAPPPPKKKKRLCTGRYQRNFITKIVLFTNNVSAKCFTKKELFWPLQKQNHLPALRNQANVKCLIPYSSVIEHLSVSVPSCYAKHSLHVSVSRMSAPRCNC